jgi:hypothetical protein
VLHLLNPLPEKDDPLHTLEDTGFHHLLFMSIRDDIESALQIAPL